MCIYLLYFYNIDTELLFTAMNDGIGIENKKNYILIEAQKCF